MLCMEYWQFVVIQFHNAVLPYNKMFALFAKCYCCKCLHVKHVIVICDVQFDRYYVNAP